MTATPASGPGASPAADRGRSGRQHFPDEVRGIALLGIVLVNVPFLGASVAGFGGVGGASAQAAEFVVTVLAQGKFYLLFAFLFGYSATFQLRESLRGSSRLFARRLVGLVVLGLAHALLFFVGDILVIYAVLGVALLLLWRARDGVLLSVAAVVAGVTAAWFAALVALTAVAPADPEADLALIASYDEAMLGTFADTVAARAEVYPVVLLLLGLVLNGGLSLVMFLLGMVAGRRGLLAQPGAHPRLWRAARRWGLAVGLPGAFGAALLTLGPSDPTAAAEYQTGPLFIAGILLGFITAPALSAGYLGLLIAVATRWPRALAVFRPAGRMSLTIYLAESVVLATVFCGWGLGLFGRLDAWAVLGIGVATWLALDVFAHLWMRRFTQGPIEYLLRWWTRGSRPSILRAAPPGRSAPRSHL